MQLTRMIGTATALAFTAALVTFLSAHPARSSDLQDSATLVNHPSADITDVYAFPSPSNSNDVVLVMNTNPLATSGATFDPNVLYQFKMVHTATPATESGGSTSAAEDTVIQFSVDQSGSGQHLTMYGPAAPLQQGSLSTVVPSTASKVIPYNQTTQITVNDASGSPQTVSVFAGLRADPEFFDLARFYSILPDRYYLNHTASSSVPAQSASSFRGFASGSTCDTSTAYDYFSTGGKDLVTPTSAGYNVLSIVVEMPKALLEQTGNTKLATLTNPYVHLWATTSTVSGV